jgi:indolepyruvate ferredoxin oxidoreductase
VATFDAQALAEEFLGDTLSANILALGYAWQCGLVPVGHAALNRAIELNGVAVKANQFAFSLGRLAAGDAQALARLRGTAPQPADDESLESLIARAVAHLTSYQNPAWAARFEATVRRVQAAEAALPGADGGLPLSRAVAASLLKLMAYKDEYEVARLYTDGSFQRQLKAQFDGALRLEFHFAPPLLARPKRGRPPRKIRLGGWVLPVLALLARGKVLRGTPLDPFGHTEERRVERALITQYEARVAELLESLSPERQALATQIAAVPMAMRGYGHVKLANVALAKAREAELLHRYQPARYPKPPRSAEAGHIRGIAVVAG